MERNTHPEKLSNIFYRKGTQDSLKTISTWNGSIYVQCTLKYMNYIQAMCWEAPVYKSWIISFIGEAVK